MTKIITLLYPADVYWSMKKIVYVMVALMLACAGVSVVSAEDYEEELYEGEYAIINEDYYLIDELPAEYADYESWYKTDNTSSWLDDYTNFDGTPQVTRQQVADLLLDESKTEEQRHQEEYELMGLTDKLKRFMNATKLQIGDTYYVKFEDDGNIITNMFGYNYQDYYEGMTAIKQYYANMRNWLGVQSRHLLHLEGY